MGQEILMQLPSSRSLSLARPFKGYPNTVRIHPKRIQFGFTTANGKCHMHLWRCLPILSMVMWCLVHWGERCFQRARDQVQGGHQTFDKQTSLQKQDNLLCCQDKEWKDPKITFLCCKSLDNSIHSSASVHKSTFLHHNLLLHSILS